MDEFEDTLKGIGMNKIFFIEWGKFSFFAFVWNI